MTCWKLTLSYDGSPFRGWQVQPGLATVQGTLASAIERVVGERVLPQGSGRTDAGVHALAQVASFALQAPIPPLNLLRALNRTLPASIRVLAAEIAPAGFHARHSALRKTYEYRIFERRQAPGASTPSLPGDAMAERICPPFLAPFVWDCPWALQLDAMQRAAVHFCGTHDFTSFAATDPDLAQRGSLDSAPNPVKTIFASECVRQDDRLLYRITGSGFLHHMVRNLAGTLAEAGRGSLAPEEMPRILAARNRGAAGPTAPAAGLFLVDVDYGGSHDSREGAPA